jgi:uncharacterized protein YgiM (DUF1202 family)
LGKKRGAGTTATTPYRDDRKDGETQGTGIGGYRTPSRSQPSRRRSAPGLKPDLGASILPSRTYRALADVTMRQGPGNGYPSIQVIARNATVSVIGERSGWLQIRLDNGSSGFVYKKWLAASS